GPGTLAGRFLRRFWHPVCLSRDVQRGKAQPITVMHQRFTLYGGLSGKAYLIGPRCAHRGAQLSAGWVEGEALRCMYHGWMFGGDCACVGPPPRTDSVHE